MVTEREHDEVDVLCGCSRKLTMADALLFWRGSLVLTCRQFADFSMQLGGIEVARYRLVYVCGTIAVRCPSLGDWSYGIFHGLKQRTLVGESGVNMPWQVERLAETL